MTSGCSTARLVITPEPVELRWIHDVFGNCVALARFAGRAQELRFESTIRLDHSPPTRLDFQHGGLRARPTRSPTAPRTCPTCCARSSGIIPIPTREVDRWARQFLRRDGRDRHARAADAMTHAIRQALRLCRARREGHAGPAPDLARGQRQLPRLRAADDGGGALAGLAARFVSGYLYVPEARDAAGGARRRRRHYPCLAAGLPAGRRLGRVRSDQRHRRQPRPDPGRGGARPAPGGAALGQLDRLSRRCSA